MRQARAMMDSNKWTVVWQHEHLLTLKHTECNNGLQVYMYLRTIPQKFKEAEELYVDELLPYDGRNPRKSP